jgi:hypothetical protein
MGGRAGPKVDMGGLMELRCCRFLTLVQSPHLYSDLYKKRWL